MKAPSPETFKFVIIAATLFVAIDFFLFGGLKLVTEEPSVQPPVSEEQGTEILASEKQKPSIAISPTPLKEVSQNDDLQKTEEPDEQVAQTYLPFPDPVENALPLVTPDATESISAHLADIEIQEPNLEPPAKVVIIIDDMGLNAPRTREVIELRAPLTLAFLPYADSLGHKTSLATQSGHELMIHIPMEAMNPDLDGGPFPLTTDLERPEFEDVLDKVFASFDGYAGVNNHMGSRLTQDAERMSWVMQRLRGKQFNGDDLYFVDSKTINTSVAAQTAVLYGIPHNTRDVFLDHYETEEDVIKALEQLERTARNRGYAIAIGHPKERTIRALKKWLPTLDNKNLELVAMSEVVKRPVMAEPIIEIDDKALDLSSSPEIILEGN